MLFLIISIKGAPPYLDRSVLERLVRVRDILHGDAVELSLVDVRQAVILAPLARRYRSLHEEAEAEVGKAENGAIPVIHQVSLRAKAPPQPVKIIRYTNSRSSAVGLFHNLRRPSGAVSAASRRCDPGSELGRSFRRNVRLVATNRAPRGHKATGKGPLS